MGAQACYFQFNSPQLAAQSAFLAELFEWEVNEANEDHAFFNHHGSEHAINGDIEATTADLATGLILYWEVDDLDVACQKAQRLGGRIIAAPSALPNNFGSIALISDLDGNTLGLYHRPISA
jgi:predicted enzyme related to lactoylglutathione lyase